MKLRELVEAAAEPGEPNLSEEQHAAYMRRWKAKDKLNTLGFVGAPGLAVLEEAWHVPDEPVTFAERAQELRERISQLGKEEIMTLAKGDKVIKLHKETGDPLTPKQGESYIEFEVEELTPHFTHSRMVPTRDDPFGGGTPGGDTYVVALLRKLR